MLGNIYIYSYCGVVNEYEIALTAVIYMITGRYVLMIEITVYKVEGRP